MIRRMNRFLAIFLSVLFVLAMLPVGVLAEGAGDTDENISANDTEGGGAPVLEQEGLEQEELEQDEPELFKSSWDPDDKITIKIRIFDMVSNKSYDNIGTDTCRKGDEKIQSDDYRIPPITKFINSDCKVDHVSDNWYFPSTLSQQVGTTVNWSCNSSTGTMTYWTRGYVPEGEGTGGGETGDGSEVIGEGQYSMNCTVVYHSNYPSGTDYTQTFKYTIRAGYNIANTGYTLPVKAPADLGFTAPAGYSLASSPWNTKANGTGSGINRSLSVKANSTTHLYAQWKSDQTTETYTLKYMNGTSQYGDTETYIAGDVVRVKDCTLPVEGSRFAGWSTTPSPTVVYKADDTFEIKGNTVLYAVWNLIQENNADYTVEHYKEKLDGTYPDTPDEKETIPGKVGEQTAAAAKVYTGFTALDFTQATIAKTGTTVRIYYVRNYYDLTIHYVFEDGSKAAEDYSGRLVFEKPYEVTSPAVAGHTPDQAVVSGNMPAEHVELTVTYTRNYTIHHVEKGKTTGNLAEDTIGTAPLGTMIDVAAQKKNIAGFAYDSCDIAEIVMGEDENEATIYYARQSYGYTIHHVELGSNKQLAEDTTGTALYGAKVVTSSAKKEIAGYAYHSDTGDIVIGTDAAANVATIYYMVPEIGMGSLKIKKTVTGEKGDKTKLFTFTVTFDRAVAYGDQPADTFTFQIKHGESITLPNIPEGTKYEVKESDHEGYRVSSSGAKGTIAAGKTSVASFVNSKGPIPITGDSGSKVLGAVIMGASILAIVGLVYVDRKLGKRKNAR